MFSLYLKQLLGENVYILASNRPVVFEGEQTVTLTFPNTRIKKFSLLAFFGTDQMLTPAKTEKVINNKGVTLQIELSNTNDIYYKRSENMVLAMIALDNPGN